MIEILCAGLFAGLGVLLIAFLIPRKNCPSCGYKLPRFRHPQSGKQAMYGGMQCPNCGVEIDRGGQLIKEKVESPTITPQLDKTPQKSCPKCAEKIQLEASVCRYCGHQFNETEVAEAQKDFQAQIERDKAGVDIREQQRMTLIRVRDLHNNVAKAKSKVNAWILPLLFGGGIGAFACVIVAIALVFIVPMVGGPSEPTAIPGCGGIVILIIAWIGATFWLRRNAKEKSSLVVEDEEDALKEAVEEITKLYTDWVSEIGGTEVLLDYQKVKNLLATYTK